MTSEELEAKVAALEKELADKAKKLEGLDSLNGKRGTELGEIREKLKANEDLQASIKTLTEKLDSATKEIESLKSTKSTTVKETQPPPLAESDTERAEKLAAALNEEERKLAEAFVKSQGQDAIKKFNTDDKYRVAVLEEVNAGNGKVAPDSIDWREKPKKVTSDDIRKQLRVEYEKFVSKGLPPDVRGGDFGRPKVTPITRKPLV